MLPTIAKSRCQLSDHWMWAGGHCKLCIICQFPEMEKLGGGGDDGGTALPPSALPRHRKGGKYFSTS